MKYIYLLILFSIIQFSIYAKRIAPKKVQSIVYNNIEYSVDHSNIGSVLITDKNSNTIKNIKIYTIEYNNNLEKDVQDIFIKNLKISNNFLLITNERNKVYRMDLSTYQITQVSD
jgi:hypothetical protein